MSSDTTHWHKEDLFVYTLLYCANADLNESVYEEADIKAKYPTVNYNHIHEEFEQDNDIARANKIVNTARHHQMTKADFDDLMAFIPNLMKSDGHISPEEQTFLHGLNELLNSLD